MHTVDEAAKAGANMIVSGTGVYKAATVTHLGLNCRRQGVPVASVMSGGRHGISNRHYEKKCGALWKRPLRRKSLTPKIRQGYLWMTGSAGKKGQTQGDDALLELPRLLTVQGKRSVPGFPDLILHHSTCCPEPFKHLPSSFKAVCSPVLPAHAWPQCGIQPLVTACFRVTHGWLSNYGPFLGTPNIRCRSTIRTEKGTLILTTTHMYVNSMGQCS